MKNKYYLFAIASLALTMSSHAADLIWDSGDTTNSTTIDPANGTWNTTVSNLVWNNAGTNAAWSAANVAVFGGSDGTYAITVGESFSAEKIRFDNSGYTLTAAAARLITITQPNTGLIVASGKTATIGTNVSVNGSSTYYIGAATASGNGGTLNIEGVGATVATVSPSNSVLIQGIGTIINVKSGGFLGTGTGNGSGGVGIGAGVTSDATLNVDGGTVNVRGSNASGSFNVGAEGKGTVTLSNSGSITINAAKTNGVTFGSSGSNTATNTFNLNGGTLTTRIVRKGAASSTAIFNFDGGTLKATTASITFMSGLNEANVKSGGAKIDTNGVNITIAQNLLDGTGGGGLIKSGSGILTLTGAGSTYTGASVVKAGTLKLNTATTLSTSSRLVAGDTGSSGAVLDVSTAGLTVGSGQTLAGIGSVLATGQTVTVNGSGKLAAGDSAGSTSALDISGGGLSMSSGSIFDWDIDTTANTSDSVSVGGSLSVTSGAIFKVVSTTAFTDTFWDTTRSWDVFGGKDLQAFTLNYQANNIVQNGVDFVAEGNFSFTNSGTTLTWTAVPEPTSALAGLLITAGLIRRRRN